MKCPCEECEGTGRCLECHGSGSCEISLSKYKPDQWHPEYERLMELKADAARIEKQFKELISLKPEREKSYSEQFEATREKLDREAEEILAIAS